jgi:copper(I)-binding protein
MTQFRSLLLAPAALLAFAAAALANDIMVMDAKAPASLTPVTKTAAIYMMLMNHGMEADVLKSVSTPAADHASAHQTIEDNGVMKMREIENLELKPHDTVTFAPGGNHIMLTGLKAPLKAGDTLPLVLTFEKAGEVTIDVQVVDKVEGSAAEHEHTDQ